MESENKRDEIEQIIITNLKKMGYNYDGLENKYKEYLIKIETSIQGIFKREQEAIELLSRSTVSIKGVSKDAGIARQTFYNVPILSEYIGFNTTKFEKVDMSEQKHLSDDKIKDLKEEIKLLHKRDVEFEEMKIDLEKLKKEIREKNSLLKTLLKNDSNITYHNFDNDKEK